MSARYLLALGLLGAGQPALAQKTPPAPRYFVGLGLYSSAFQRLGNNYGNTTFPVQVVGGYQWRPRWAVQLGVAYSGYSDEYAYDGQVLNSATGNVESYSSAGHATDRRLGVALLARRTLTRQPAHRLQVDAVGGLTYEHGSYHEAGSSTTYNPQSTIPYEYQGQYNGLLVGLGAGLRLRVAPRLDVLLDVLLNTPLSNQGGSGGQSATTLGLRYRLGPAS